METYFNIDAGSSFILERWRKCRDFYFYKNNS